MIQKKVKESSISFTLQNNLHNPEHLTVADAGGCCVSVTLFGAASLKFKFKAMQFTT